MKEGKDLQLDTPVRNFLRGVPIVARRAGRAVTSPAGLVGGGVLGFVSGLAMVVTASPEGPTHVANWGLEEAGLATMVGVPVIAGGSAAIRGIARAGRKALDGDGLVRRDHSLNE